MKMIIDRATETRKEFRQYALSTYVKKLTLNGIIDFFKMSMFKRLKYKHSISKNLDFIVKYNEQGNYRELSLLKNGKDIFQNNKYIKFGDKLSFLESRISHTTAIGSIMIKDVEALHHSKKFQHEHNSK